MMKAFQLLLMLKGMCTLTVTDTVDFDPGIGVTNLVSNHWKSDIFICKYDPAGNLVWANQIGGGNVYIVTAISASLKGNIYLFGTFFDTVDFDPGPAVTQLYSSLRDNFFVAKYNTSGNLKFRILNQLV